jgi:hypothetical protein
MVVEWTREVKGEGNGRRDSGAGLGLPAADLRSLIYKFGIVNGNKNGRNGREGH